MIEKMAEWLYRYRSYNRRRGAWEKLCEEESELAESYRRDAQRLLDDCRE